MNDIYWGGAVEASFANTGIIWIVEYELPIGPSNAHFKLKAGYLDVHVAQALAKAWNLANPPTRRATAYERTVTFAGKVANMRFATNIAGPLILIPPGGYSVQVVEGLHVFRG